MSFFDRDFTNRTCQAFLSFDANGDRLLQRSEFEVLSEGVGTLRAEEFR